MHNEIWSIESDKAKLDAFLRVMFLSPMTDDEICSYFGFDDIRKLRRFHPDRLALVLFKCVEQLAEFVDHHDQISDYCSVMNALRMLGNALPYCFEDIALEGTTIKETTIVSQRTVDRIGKQVLSPFAARFGVHFFWENKTCQGHELEMSSTVEKWAAHPRKWNKPVGVIVVQTLTALCFVPRFTVGAHQRPSAVPQGHREEMAMRECAPSAKVDTGLLWYGATTQAALHGVTLGQVDKRRIQVLRTLIQCLSWNVFFGAANLENPFLSTLVDEELCPLGPTLCLCMVNSISCHRSRGILPYTSYLNAENPEKILQLSLSVLSIVFDLPNEPTNSFIRVLRVIVDKDRQKADRLVSGLQRVIDNPMYSARTFFHDSQKTVECTQESLLLAFHLQDCPTVHTLMIERMHEFLYPLLFFVQECARHESMVHDMQAAILLLVRLSANEAFLRAFANSPIQRQPPLFVLPSLLKDGNSATIADVIVLMMCFVVSPASPRWFLPAFPGAATIFANVVSAADKLAEVTCFEIHHALEFLTHRNVLKKGELAQGACQLWVEGVVTVATRNPRGCAPLLASLGIGNAAMTLQQLYRESDEADAAALSSKREGDEEAPSSAPEHHRPIRWIPGFMQNMPIADLAHLSAEAKRKLEGQPYIEGASGENRTQAYDAVLGGNQAGVAMPSNPLVHQMKVSLEVRRWLSGAIWRTLHSRNLRPPLFDYKSVKLY